MPQPQPHRRGLVLGALGLAGAGIGARLVTMDDIDTSAAERERIAADLDDVAERWEDHGPQTSRARLYGIENRLGIVARGHSGAGDWAALGATTLVMLAQAEADSGDQEAAASTAQRAMSVAMDAEIRPLAAHAEMISGEIFATIAPTGDEPIAMLEAARRRAGGTAVGAQAATLEAHARAVRGQPADTVLDVLSVAAAIQDRLPASSGWPRWTSGHLHAFGGAALVQAGALRRASEWLSMAQEETRRQPGIGTAVTLYQAHGYAAAGEWDAARAYAADAVGSASQRGSAAWLAGGITRLARQARGRGGDWAALRTAATV